MADDDGIEQAARDAIKSFGVDAVADLLGRAEMADEIGDAFSATTWREIAEVAARMLR